jgi:hypothetical protein
LVTAKIPSFTTIYTLRLFIPVSLSKSAIRFKRSCVHKISTKNIVKISTKGHNSLKFGCRKNSFLYYHLHIKVVHPCKLKQNLTSGLTGVAFKRFRDVRTDWRTDGRTDWRSDGRTSATLYAPTLGGGGIKRLSIFLSILQSLLDSSSCSKPTPVPANATSNIDTRTIEYSIVLNNDL